MTLISLGSLGAIEEPPERFSMTEFSWKGHWYIKFYSSFAHPFIHHPDCPCNEKKVNKVEEKNHNVVITIQKMDN